MTTDVYERLATFLDGLPAGFPTTESGAEQRILRRLFTPEEAAFVLHLTVLPEPARVIARRARLPREAATQRLQEMERKGLIYAIHAAGKEPEYMAIHWAIGIYEFQVGRLSRGLVEDLSEFWPVFTDQPAWFGAPQLRTIPVGEAVGAQGGVLPYERAEALVRAQTNLAIAPCVCRQEARLAGHGCDKPLETCLMLGAAAAYYVQNGLGRAIGQGEALAALAQANEAGLVLQPGNARDASSICMCCGCCCNVLTHAKRLHPKPATVIPSAFQAALAQEACRGCGTCETRCQMEAIHVDGGRAAIDLDRCIGCGLCVTACPSHALSLQRKAADQQPYVPKDVVETNIRVGQARGRLSMVELLRMVVRSKVDRLLARK